MTVAAPAKIEARDELRVVVIHHVGQLPQLQVITQAPDAGLHVLSVIDSMMKSGTTNSSRSHSPAGQAQRYGREAAFPTTRRGRRGELMPPG